MWIVTICTVKNWKKSQHYLYPNPPVNVTPEHTTAIILSVGQVQRATSPCVLWSEKLTAYILRNSMHSSTTLVLMYIKPRHVIWNGDFGLLRIKSRDVTPWGLVDKTQTIWRNLLPPSSGCKSSFLLTLKMEMLGSTKMFVPMCKTPPYHIPWTHNLNTFYTANTDFACILLAFRVAQHDSLAEMGP